MKGFQITLNADSAKELLGKVTELYNGLANWSDADEEDDHIDAQDKADAEEALSLGSKAEEPEEVSIINMSDMKKARAAAPAPAPASEKPKGKRGRKPGSKNAPKAAAPKPNGHDKAADQVAAQAAPAPAPTPVAPPKVDAIAADAFDLVVPPPSQPTPQASKVVTPDEAFNMLKEVNIKLGPDAARGLVASFKVQKFSDIPHDQLPLVISEGRKLLNSNSQALN